MRMMLKAVIDTEVGNEVFRSGGATGSIDQMVDAFQPEAFYAVGEDGQRAVFIVFDLADASQIPVLCEPLYNMAKAKITLAPCMTLEDLKKGVEEASARMQPMQGQSSNSPVM